MNARQTEFFGPDLGRGPFSSQRIETSVVQIATALAQLRAPLSRSDADLLSHADFIRELADRLAPDYACAVTFTIGEEASNTIQTTVRVATGTWNLLDCWLADSSGGVVTAVAPAAVTVSLGTVLETIAPCTRYLILTPATGVVNLSVTYAGMKDYYWAVTRLGRVFYSSRLRFM